MLSPKVVIDTNILLDNPSVIDEYNCIILSHVLREVENHKLSHSNELSFKARNATRYIELNVDKVEFDFRDYAVSFSNEVDHNYTDNKIIECCMQNNYNLATKDLLLKHKAIGYGIKIVDNKMDNSQYKGYKYVSLKDEDQAYLYEHLDENIYNLLINQYLIVSDENGKVIDKLRWNGNRHVKLLLPKTKKIKSLNHLQDCAIDMLNNTDIPIKFIVGNYGSGKTLLSVKSALYQVLEKGSYSKIMMVRNPIGTGQEIGFLKGDKDQKTEGFFKPFIQHLDEGEQEANYLEQRGILSKEIPYYMKGLSIEDTLILCDEAEDLDVKLIRLIGTRLGDNSAVIYSGDYNQVENVYKQNNGLVNAIAKLKGNPLVGVVVLEEDVRSSASKVFAELE